MKCTSFGSFFRVLRLQNGEILQDASRFLGVTSAYISAVECGKRPVPEEWEEKIILHYGLSESEREALRAAIEGAKAVVRIPLSDASELCRAAALHFARAFSTMDDETASRLLQILQGEEIPDAQSLFPKETVGRKPEPAKESEEKKTAAPIKGTSMQESPIEGAAIKGAPAERVAVEGPPVKGVPSKGAAAEVASIEGMPVEEAPVEEAPVEGAPPEPTPTLKKDAPAFSQGLTAGKEPYASLQATEPEGRKDSPQTAPIRKESPVSDPSAVSKDKQRPTSHETNEKANPEEKPVAQVAERPETAEKQPEKHLPHEVPPQIPPDPGTPPAPMPQVTSPTLPEEDDKIQTLVSKEGFPAGTVGAVVESYPDEEACAVEVWDKNEFPVGIVIYRFSEIKVIS